MNHRYSILVGNGVSLAYNSQLGVANLTTELQTEFENLGVTAAEVALTKLARESRRDPSGGFESMLGPLETTARSLEALSDLTPLAASTATATELRSICVFVEAVHRTGLSIVLGKIAALSSGVGRSRFGRNRRLRTRCC